jgi:DNA (cytosine-5)-methyltransferase 1
MMTETKRRELAKRVENDVRASFSMKIGSLFSGIGGFELGLERAGLGKVVYQVEIDPFRREILARHWPNVRRYVDVEKVEKDVGSEGYGIGSLPRVDVVCGGFPCQDVSSANVRSRKRLDGRKSGLWREFFRVILRLCDPNVHGGFRRPIFIFVENVGSTWRDWLPVVRGDLGRLGYTSLPLRLSPATLGAPHHRDRVFVVACSLADADAESELLRTVDAEVARIQADAGRLESHWRKPFAGPVRVDDGVSRRMDRVAALGDSVVPQVAEMLGRAVVTSFAMLR